MGDPDAPSGTGGKHASAVIIVIMAETDAS